MSVESDNTIKIISHSGIWSVWDEMSYYEESTDRGESYCEWFDIHGCNA